VQPGHKRGKYRPVTINRQRKSSFDF